MSLFYMFAYLFDVWLDRGQLDSYLSLCNCPITTYCFFFFLFKVCLAPAQLPQLCPIPCNLMDCSPPDSSVHEIFQVRILEWVTMPSSGIFLTHRSNPCLLGLLNCRQILYPLSHLGSPGLELRTTFTHPVCGIWGDS